MELTFEEEIFGRCNAFGVCRNKKREIILLDHPVCQAKSKSFPETSQTVDDESNGNNLECLDDDSSNDDEDEADESVPDKGGDPIGDRTH